jgi:hypothetical protein
VDVVGLSAVVSVSSHGRLQLHLAPGLGQESGACGEGANGFTSGVAGEGEGFLERQVEAEGPSGAASSGERFWSAYWGDSHEHATENPVDTRSLRGWGGDGSVGSGDRGGQTVKGGVQPAGRSAGAEVELEMEAEAGVELQRAMAMESIQEAQRETLLAELEQSREELREVRIP